MLSSDSSHHLSKLLAVTRRPINGPLGLDVVMIFGLEMTTQLEEALASADCAGMAALLVSANRATVVQVLEHICKQLL